MTTVSLLTRNAATDDLTVEDYQQIYAELREQRPLREFVELIASQYSIAWWSKWEAGDIRLTRRARNELRRAVALPQLPPAVAELLADPSVVSPDAAVYAVGFERLNVGTLERSNRVVLIGEQISGLDIHVNSDVSIRASVPESVSHPLVTPVTSARPRAIRKTLHLHPVTAERLTAARSDTGLSIDAFVAALLDHWSEP
jgi:hypothetical protein